VKQLTKLKLSQNHTAVYLCHISVFSLYIMATNKKHESKLFFLNHKKQQFVKCNRY